MIAIRVCLDGPGVPLRMTSTPLSSRPKGWFERLPGAVDRLLGPTLRANGRGGRGAGLRDDATGDPGPRPDDLNSFDRAFAAHQEDVARVCRRLLGGSEEARDAPQEVFLRARRSLHTYDRERPFRPWLLTIAGNYCIDRLRQQSSEQRIFSDFDPEEVPADEGAAPSPLVRMVAREERQAVGRAIAKLSLKYRLPLALRYFSELDYAAIAEVLGVSRGQVGSLLFRARRQLREAVEEARGGRR